MKKKKQKKKKPALRSPALNIEGKVVSIFPTESIQLDLKRGFEDFNYLMEDGSIKHFEFASTNEGVRGLRRFRWYEAQLSYQHSRPVITYVLFSGKIKKPMTELKEGENTYRIHPILSLEQSCGAQWYLNEIHHDLISAIDCKNSRC